MPAASFYLSLFEDIGPVVKTLNLYHGFAANSGANDIEGLRNSVHAALNANGTDSAMPGVTDAFERYRNQVSGSLAPLVDLVRGRLLDRDTVRTELQLADSDGIARMLSELIRNMRADSQSVQSSVPTVPSTGTASGSNTGSGALLLTSTLDGYSSPAASQSAHLDYAGQTSEMIVPSDSLTVRCTQDAHNSGLPSGQEVFAVATNSGWRQPYDYRTEGSGQSATLRTDLEDTLTANADFAAWSSGNLPSNFDVISGQPGVDFAQETQTANVITGQSSLQVLGNFQLDQVVPPGLTVQANRLYRLSFLTNAAIARTPTITFTIASQSGAVTFPAALSVTSVGTSATIHTATMLMPATLADDLRFRLTVADYDGEFWLDQLTFAPVKYLAGVGMNVVPGDIAFAREDRFTAAISAVEGVFQQFFRRVFGTQLPSNASPTIADSLAT